MKKRPLTPVISVHEERYCTTHIIHTAHTIHTIHTIPHPSLYTLYRYISWLDRSSALHTVRNNMAASMKRDVKTKDDCTYFAKCFIEESGRCYTHVKTQRYTTHYTTHYNTTIHTTPHTNTLTH